ncbi:hypothetical protein NL676_021442 [Syzygium grande]|nr:hypothetical protein NL676_021442 [Syzygium grande]
MARHKFGRAGRPDQRVDSGPNGRGVEGIDGHGARPSHAAPPPNGSRSRGHGQAGLAPPLGRPTLPRSAPPESPVADPAAMARPLKPPQD